MRIKTRLLSGSAIMFLLVGGACAHAAGTKIVELWRSPFGYAWSVSQDDLRHTCWVSTGGSVLRLSPDGNILFQANGFWTPESVSTNSGDGSVWVADTFEGKVVHLAIDGKELAAATGFSLPISVSVNTLDDSVWVADMGATANAIIHLAEDGTEIGRITGLVAPISVSVNNKMNDGTVWVAELGIWDSVQGKFVGSAVSHYASTASDPDLPLWRDAANYNGPNSVSADANDSSCWVADTFNNQVVHLSSSGGETARVSGFNRPRGVSADRMHSSCWVADTKKHRIVQLASNGAQMSESTGFYWPLSVSAVPTGSLCWVADSSNCEVVVLSGDGREQMREGWLYQPMSVACHPLDKDVWVADWGLEGAPTGHMHGGVRKIDDTGRVIWSNDNFSRPISVSILPVPRTAWVADNEAGEVVNLSISGAAIRRLSGYLHPTSVSVSEHDNSVWFATEDVPTGMVFHLSSTGGLIGVRDDLTWPYAVAASPNYDVGWAGSEGWVHLLPADCKTVQSIAGFDSPWALSINANDDSCWVADFADVVHLASNGGGISTTAGFNEAVSVSVNSNPDHDNGCWVGDCGNVTGDLVCPVVGCNCDPVWTRGFTPHYVVYLDSTGNEVARDHGYLFPYSVAVSESDGTAWVADTWNGQLVHIMAADFTDVYPYYWAYRYIGGCAHAGIVSGYPDGTYRPELPVTRDAMAVFVSRAIAGGDSLVPGADHYPVPSFTDIPATYWAYRYIEYAKEMGVVGGYPAGDYQPLLTVDRSQMAAFVARAMAGGDANVPPGPGTPTFPDVPTTYWAYRYIEYCHSQGVVSGYDDGYHPTEVVTRAQMAVYIARAFDLDMPK